MMPDTMHSPSPVPLPMSLVVKNGSKIRSRISGGMPTPLSPIVTTTQSPAVRVVMCTSPLAGSGRSAIASLAFVSRFVHT